MKQSLFSKMTTGFAAVIALAGMMLGGISPVLASGGPVNTQLDILNNSTMEMLVLRSTLTYVNLPKSIAVALNSSAPRVIVPLKWKLCGEAVCTLVNMEGKNFAQIDFGKERYMGNYAGWMWSTSSDDNIHWKINRESNYRFDGQTLKLFNAQNVLPQKVTVVLKNGSTVQLTPVCSVSLLNEYSTCTWKYAYPELIKRWVRVPGQVIFTNVLLYQYWQFDITFEGEKTFVTLTRVN